MEQLTKKTEFIPKRKYNTKRKWEGLTCEDHLSKFSEIVNVLMAKNKETTMRQLVQAVNKDYGMHATHKSHFIWDDVYEMLSKFCQYRVIKKGGITYVTSRDVGIVKKGGITYVTSRDVDPDANTNVDSNNTPQLLLLNGDECEYKIEFEDETFNLGATTNRKVFLNDSQFIPDQTQITTEDEELLIPAFSTEESILPDLPEPTVQIKIESEEEPYCKVNARTVNGRNAETQYPSDQVEPVRRRRKKGKRLTVVKKPNQVALRNAALRNAALRNADLRNTELRDAAVREADINYAALCEVTQRDADLLNAVQQSKVAHQISASGKNYEHQLFIDADKRSSGLDILDQCHYCTDIITGSLYRCLQCEWRSCAQCEASGVHKHHTIMRAAAATLRTTEMLLVLENMREILKKDEDCRLKVDNENLPNQLIPYGQNFSNKKHKENKNAAAKKTANNSSNKSFSLTNENGTMHPPVRHKPLTNEIKMIINHNNEDTDPPIVISNPRSLIEPNQTETSQMTVQNHIEGIMEMIHSNSKVIMVASNLIDPNIIQSTLQNQLQRPICVNTVTLKNQMPTENIRKNYTSVQTIEQQNDMKVRANITMQNFEPDLDNFEGSLPVFRISRNGI